VTTKKIIREVEYYDNEPGELAMSERAILTAVTERKFTYSQELHATMGEFEDAIQGAAVQSIYDIFDRKTVVLDDSDGGYFAVPGYNIKSARVYVIDSLDV